MKITALSYLLKVLLFSKKRPILFFVIATPLAMSFFSIIFILLILLSYKFIPHVFHITIDGYWILFIFTIVVAPFFFITFFIIIESYFYLIHKFLLFINFTWYAKIIKFVMGRWVERKMLYQLIEWTTNKLIKLKGENYG